MTEVRAFHGREGGSLTVRFGDPSQEFVCKEAGGEAILMQNAAGRIIGIERLNLANPVGESPRLEPAIAPAQE